MGHDAPYIYSYKPVDISTGFNPRLYSERAATQAALLKHARPKPQGPLLNFNRHPDAWMIVASNDLHTEEVLPPNIVRKIVATRWLQLFLRIIQFFAALGMFICVVCIKGTQGQASWVLRVPAPFDAIVCTYAIYHLLRPVGSRTPASSSSYQWFSLCVDGGLLPFYVYATIFTQANYSEAANTPGRWTTYFSSATSTDIILLTAWITSSALCITHFASSFFSLFLGLWFRKIAMLSPDFNPLAPQDTAAQDEYKQHKHKSSDMSSYASSFRDEKRASGSTFQSSQSQTSLHRDNDLDEPRRVPFAQTRVNGSVAFNPHTLESVRAQGSQHSLVSQSQPRSTVSDRSRGQDGLVSPAPSRYKNRHLDERQPVMGPYAPPHAPAHLDSLSSESEAPYGDMPLSPRQQELVKDNWYATHYHDQSDQPLHSHRAHAMSEDKAYPDDEPEDKENADQVGRALTMGSSLYSGSSNRSKYYGALSDEPLQPSPGRDGRAVSKGTGAEVVNRISSSTRRILSIRRW